MDSPTVPRLILASRSAARASILRKAGIKFSVKVSDVDEDAVTARKNLTLPLQIAKELALAKAESVTLALRGTKESFFVLGCDSVFERNGTAYGKPRTAEIATRRIKEFQGKSGTLHTAHWLINTSDGSGKGATSSAVIHFDSMDPAEIKTYVASGEPLQAAGSFTLDGMGSNFIKSIEGSPAAVIGLDVNVLKKLLSYFAVNITNLWR